MDGSRFDDLSRYFSQRRSRRGLAFLLGGLTLAERLTQLALTETAAKGKHKKKRKKKKRKCSYTGQRRCGNRCIGEKLCCNDAECRPRGECAGCVQGECLADGRKCIDIYGPCYSCNPTSLTCVAAADGETCGDCRFCQGGNCVGCPALGECAGCQNGRCIPDGTICVNTHGPCFYCDAIGPPYACRSRGTPCQAGSETQCCRDDQTCCDVGCVNLNETKEHCGSCDNACVGLQYCDRGQCRCPDPLIWCQSARICRLAEQTCCGQEVCAEGENCCGSADSMRCSGDPC